MFDEYRDCLYAYKEALAVYTITAAQCTTCIVLQQCSMYMYMFRLHAHACVHVQIIYLKLTCGCVQLLLISSNVLCAHDV